jgi:enterochelin esterase family protein
MMIRRFLRAFHSIQTLVLLLAFAAPAFVAAQIPAFTPATEIHPDRSVTFRYKDDGATFVLLGLEGIAKPMPMAKAADGIWTLTTQPLAPEIYGYHFEVDNQPRLDLSNVAVTPNLVNPTARCTIIATPPLPSSVCPATRATTMSTLRPATTRRRRRLTRSSTCCTAGPTARSAGRRWARLI